METKHPRYHFRLKPVPDDRPPERVAGRTAEEMHADFLAQRYEPTIGVFGESLPCPVEITLGIDRNERLAVTALRVDAADHGTVVTATGLRQIGNMITDLLRRIAAPGAHTEDEGYHVLAPVLAGLAASYKGVAVRPGRRGYTPEQYREWALAFREAIATDPDHPYTWLAGKWVCVESQARRRVQRARELFPELFEEVGE